MFELDLEKFPQNTLESKSVTIMKWEIITVVALWKSEILSIHNLIDNIEICNF